MRWAIAIGLSWGATALAFLVADWIFDGVAIDNWWALILASGVFGVVNTILKPLAVFLAIPLIILTLGVAYFFVNVLMLWITDAIVGGLSIDGFWTFVGATIVIWAANSLIHMLPLPWGGSFERRPAY